MAPPDSRRDDLYETDFYAWTQAQAAALRAGAAARLDAPLDWGRLAEEVEDLGRSERDAVRSQVRRIIEHLLKLECSPAAEPRDTWIESVIEARAAIDDKLTPTLRTDLVQRLPRLYDQARAKAEVGLRRFGGPGTLPAACPYPLERILAEGWYPAVRRAPPP